MEDQTEYFLKCIEQNKPQEVNDSEWRQIFNLKVVQQSWGIEEDTKQNYERTFLNWKATVYLAKFNFMSGSPGYVGPLFLLHGDHIVGPAITITQNERNELYDVEEF